MKKNSLICFNMLVILILVISLTACNFTGKNNWQISSPDEEILVELYLDETTGTLFYSSKFAEQQYNIINKSQLGIELNSGNYTSGLTFLSVEINEDLTEDYSLVSGKKRIVKEYYNYAKFNFENDHGKKINIAFKVFNDGFAFRYEIPESSENKFLLKSESTSFAIPENGNTWLQPYDLVGKWTPGYERIFTNGSAIGENAPDSSNGWCFPMLFELERSWVLITEAGADNNNCGMHIKSDCKGGIYKIAFPVKEEAGEVCSRYPEFDFPWNSSWRVVILGRELKNIFESNLVTNLSEPNISGNIDWIRPGRAAWSWWSDSDSPQDYSKQKKYIDFAADMGWEYSLVDANWNKMKGGNVEELAKYAAKKNVGLLLWYNSGGPHNIVEEEPRDRMHIPEMRRKEFKWLNEIGVKGIKVDFFQSDKQCIIQLYHDILKDALDYNLLVNFHGCTLPRGWNRTYPNLLAMEAVRGGEVYKFGSTFPDEAPVMNTIYAFTRNVVGPMDYTPVTFSDHNFPHKTSYAHELATSIVFESGIVHFADSYQSYYDQPEYVTEFLKNIDNTWDESILIDGYPGKDIIVGRRKGSKWYIAGLNSESHKKDIVCNIDFLDDGTYTAKIIRDGKNGKEFSFSDDLLENNDTIKIQMLSYGGFTIELTKK